MSDKMPENLKTVEERDREWLETVYRGDKERDLTPRAVLAGMVFGGLMSLSNLYVGLKSGWGLGVDIAAVIVIFAVFKGLRGVGLVKEEFGMMENTVMMSVAVAASWISSAGLVSAVPALTMLTGYQFVWWQLALFIGIILYMGLFMAIPLKRQMIQIDSLRFPGNIPTGETLKAMYSHGDQAMKKAKALGIAGVLGMAIAGVRDGLKWIPSQVPFSGLSIGRVHLSKLTLSLEPSLIFIGIGALFGMKVGLSMLLGLVLNYAVLAPNFIEAKVIRHAAPQVRAVAAPDLPLAVQKGQALTVVLEEATAAPELASGATTNVLRYTWAEPATYASVADLQRDLSAPTMQDGQPNPLHGVILVSNVQDKAAGTNVLVLEASSATNWEARLSISDKMPVELAEALGFRGSTEFAANDLTDLASLATRLRTTNDPGARYLQSRLSHETKRVLDSGGGGASLTNLPVPLCEDINRIIGGPLIFGPGHFAEISLRPATKKLAEAKPSGARLMLANRLLLEDAFPTELSRKRMPDAAKKENIGGFKNIAAWSLWPGATVLVVGGLLALAFQWRTLARTFGSIYTSFGDKENRPRGALDHLEIPMAWFVLGFAVTGLMAAALLAWLFSIHWYMGLLAVVLSFFLAAVATRAAAETSINPIGPMGKVTQLTYGVIAPGNIPANLMTAGVTAGAACSCSDTVGNLKVGHMVGANPRRQFIGQLFGVLAGAVLAVPVYFILVPDANALGGEKFPAPSALIWMGVAKVLAKGLSTLPRSAVIAMIIAFVVGVAIVIIDRVFPKAKPYTPSPAALGISMTIPAYTSFAMFLGAFIVWILEKKAKDWNNMYTIPIASGCIAGESIMGVIVAILMALGIIQ
jgi:uncharacterized oligopeptide transporter (OPT) family protein